MYIFKEMCLRWWNIKKIVCKIQKLLSNIPNIRYECAIQNSVTWQCDTIQYNAVRYDAMRWDTKRYYTIGYDTTRHDTTQHSTIRYDTVRCIAMQYDTIQLRAVKYRPILVYNLFVLNLQKLHWHNNTRRYILRTPPLSVKLWVTKGVQISDKKQLIYELPTTPQAQ